MTPLDTGPAAVRPLRPIVPLLTRLVVAQVFVFSGLHKFEDYDAAVAEFGKLGLPAHDVLTGVVGAVEIAGGVALALGLFTRLAALLLCGVMLVALGTAHAQEVQAALVLRPPMGKGLPSITAFVMLALLAWLLVWGPGSISVDRIRMGRRRKGLAPSEPTGPMDRTQAPLRTHREKLEPSRARAERENMLPSRVLGSSGAAARRSEAPRETGGPLSGRLPPEGPPEIDAPGLPRL
jgi:putative oxidoreductase